jgi:hypothetical protein
MIRSQVRFAFGLVASAALCSGVAHAGEAVAPEVQAQLDQQQAAGFTLTRAEVMAELRQARLDGVMTAAGEIAEPNAVLDSRDRVIVAQTRETAERYARLDALHAARAAAQAAARASALAEAQRAATPQVANADTGQMPGVITERADVTPDLAKEADKDSAPARKDDEPERPAQPSPTAIVQLRKD